MFTNPPFDPDNFSDNDIDNPNLPMEPGSLWVYRSEDELNFVWATDRTKEIAGVDTTVVRDVVFSGGTLTETTRDFLAQDDTGNVWYFGELSAELDNGQVSFEGSWQAGRNGAQAGIIMEAHPHVGDTYVQENAPGVAEDQATVVSVDASVDVPFGSFDHVLQTQETSPLEPTVRETKSYAHGVGTILEVDETGQRSELVFFRSGDHGGDDDHDDHDDDHGNDDHGDDCDHGEVAPDAATHHFHLADSLLI
jgi:hypothetical protein